ncbi:twin-arginine translocation signal domain-containing protein [Natronococcus wangiae]|uniref:twin-arginine translocation signal domain-containing protein n=1 Tax=Natronococcus wangiae TaxID=3068275 RepID=UPI00274021E8|nr:twin-arginine translocation signal domain-containing protein [Natronococcus sp. AD5]
MRETGSTTRRNVLKIAGAAGATALIAGCSDGGGNGGNGGGGGNGGESQEGGQPVPIEPDTRIVFEAQTQYWLGVEPEDIADQENPTLALQDGESYEIGWEEGDGATHNIELVDDSDEVVDDYQTEEATEGGPEQFIEFDMSGDIAEYVCRPHQGTMRGTIEMEGGG